ncbi:MAG: hypothetical protein J5947_08800 [Clostridium sp.]|nr:hypothetical protein [Clostridium sp.]MBO6149984.1 hypothetical protein [Clostridium sp.]
MTRHAAYYLAPCNLRVNSIHPGPSWSWTAAIWSALPHSSGYP